MNEKQQLRKGGYYVEVSCSDGKKVIWEVLDNHVVEDPKDNDDILLWVFGFNFFTKTREGGGTNRIN